MLEEFLFQFESYKEELEILDQRRGEVNAGNINLKIRATAKLPTYCKK